jgi:REP element-mobilizing transposase RayT
MTTARFRLVDTKVTRWYHLVSRCVRSAWLLQDDGTNNRKDWIDQRLKELDQIFAVSVGGFSIMDNHLHVLVRIDDEQAKTWSPLEVAKRWTRLFPPRGADRKPMKPTDEFLQLRANNPEWVEEARKRLSSLGWFMKCLKEPLSRMANKQDECKGAFFEGRYKSIAILDEEALLTVCAYIDLNPVAAGIVSLPEESPHTSIKERVDHAKSKGRMCDVSEIRNGSVAASKVSGKVEKGLWLIPIEDRRRLGEDREGMREGFTFGQYLLLVDYTSRTIRKGKASVSKELEGIFERLGSSAEIWSSRVKKLQAKPWMGRFLSASRDRLRALASKLGVQRLANIG